MRFLGNGFGLALCSLGWLATQKFVILVPDPIHLPSLPLRSFLWYRGTRRLWAMGSHGPRTNCRTTTATVLTATAGATLSLRVRLCFSLVPTAIKKTTTAGTFHNVYFPKQLDTSKPCVFLSRHDLSRHISQGDPPRTGSTAVFVRGMA